ncbi:MAG: hypothetical protein U1D66_10360, partial [Erythrobacter sp.]|nr:hypothetical protein [Erythrobacter sp.]
MTKEFETDELRAKPPRLQEALLYGATSWRFGGLARTNLLAAWREPECRWRGDDDVKETEVQIPPERLDQIAHRFAELEARMASGTLEGEAFVRASRDYAELQTVAKIAA